MTSPPTMGGPGPLAVTSPSPTCRCRIPAGHAEGALEEGLACGVEEPRASTNPIESAITLTVNGSRRTVRVSPSTTLLEMVRTDWS